MNLEEARKFQDDWMAAQSKWGNQDENGIDLGHLRANLKLTPTQRAEKHRLALGFALEWTRAADDPGILSLHQGIS